MNDSYSFPFMALEDDDFLNHTCNPQAPSTERNNLLFEDSIIKEMSNNVQEIKLNYDPHDSANQLAPSSYFTNNLLKTYLDLHRNNELFFLHLNIRSAHSNFEKFRFFFENVDFPTASIVGLTET